jgi:hypothetical protein
LAGRHYLNNRYHDPVLGAFVSVDPLVSLSKDPYAYSSNNPITYSDPSGLCDGSCFIPLPNGAVPVGGCSADPGVCDLYNTSEGRSTLRGLWQQQIDFTNLMDTKGVNQQNYGPSCSGNYFMIQGCSHLAADRAIGANPNTGRNDYWVDTDSFGYNAFMMTYYALLTPPFGGAFRGGAVSTVDDVARTVDDVMGGLSPGRQAHVRTVSSQAELQSVYDELAGAGTPTQWTGYKGPVVRRPDGIEVGIRQGSKSGGATIDIRLPDGTTKKVHIK